MFCEVCGSQMRDGSKFCPSCGATVGGGAGAVSGSHSAHAVAPAVAPMYAQPATVQQQPYGTPPQGRQTGAPPYGGRQTHRAAPGDIPADKDITMGAWMLTIFIMIIPLVGFIMTLIWAFGNSAPLFKRNFAKAMLVYYLIGIVASILFGFLIPVMFVSMY